MSKVLSPALDKLSDGLLGSKPLRPSPPVPAPVVSPLVQEALSKYPEQKPKVMAVVAAKEMAKRRSC